MSVSGTPPPDCQLLPLVGCSGDSMDFELKPDLERSAIHWLDAEKTSGIEFHGPDTFEHQRFMLEVSRASSAAEKRIHDYGIDHESEQAEDVRKIMMHESMKASLPLVFKAAHNITLSGEEVTQDNCALLFKAMKRNQIIMCGNFVAVQSSFLGKQSAGSAEESDT